MADRIECIYIETDEIRKCLNALVESESNLGSCTFLESPCIRT